jgi:hypothetical protein
MAQEGDYPFLVYVRNQFIQSTDSNVNVITVTYLRHPYGKNSNVIESYNHNIQPGEVLCFPLYWNDESLSITLPDTIELSHNKNYYYIWCGPKANCRFSKTNGFEFIPSPAGKNPEEYGYFWGGTWRFPKDQVGGTLTIEKLKPDPETENVTVGEDDT